MFVGLKMYALYLQTVKESDLCIQVTVEKLNNFSWVIFNKLQRLSRWNFFDKSLELFAVRI